MTSVRNDDESKASECENEQSTFPRHGTPESTPENALTHAVIDCS